MGKIETLSIVFDKSSDVFFAGEILSGMVNIIISEKLKVKNVFLYKN